MLRAECLYRALQGGPPCVLSQHGLQGLGRENEDGSSLLAACPPEVPQLAANRALPAANLPQQDACRHAPGASKHSAQGPRPVLQDTHPGQMCDTARHSTAPTPGPCRRREGGQQGKLREGMRQGMRREGGQQGMQGRGAATRRSCRCRPSRCSARPTAARERPCSRVVGGGWGGGGQET